jgi:hypothetical protein
MIATSANLANAILKLVAADALPALVGNLVVGNLVRRNYEPVLAKVGDEVALQTSSGSANVRLSTRAFATFHVPDITKALAFPELLRLYMQTAINRIAAQVETDLLSIGASVVMAGSTISESMIELAETNLFRASVPANEPKFLVVDADTYSTLRRIPRFTEYYSTREAGLDSVAPGNVGKLRDFFVFRSNHVRRSQRGVVHNLAFPRDSIALVMRRMPQPLPDGPGVGAVAEYAELGNFGLRVVMKYNPNALAQEFTIDILYGCAVLRQDWLVGIDIGGGPVHYTPAIDGDVARFQLRLQRCNCGAAMIDIPVSYRNVSWVHDLFPRVSDEGLEAQMRRANIRFVSGSLDVNNKPICQQCEADGKSEFLCDLCQKVKPSSKRKERFGDPPEFLCTDCYATTPAKVWEKAMNDLEQAHRWDYA